jgi:hypothetical protein
MLLVEGNLGTMSVPANALESTGSGIKVDERSCEGMIPPQWAATEEKAKIEMSAGQTPSETPGGQPASAAAKGKPEKAERNVPRPANTRARSKAKNRDSAKTEKNN